MGGFEADATVAVEARIAEELLRLTRGRRVGSQVVPPAPYLRRHAVEHAAAGQILDERYLSAEFLPFADAARLRPLVAHRRRDKQSSPGLVEAWRRAAHVWSWGSPGANADALAFWCAALGQPSEVFAVGGLWRTRWAVCRIGSGEILGRHTDWVMAVATAVLPDGRPIAITGSEDATVRIWDLVTATPIGQPLTGHTSGVMAVATAVLPDGRPIAITGGWDATVRIWDPALADAAGHPLHVTAIARGVAMCRSGQDVIAVIVGDGVARVDVKVLVR
jgi:hypothetical protein